MNGKKADLGKAFLGRGWSFPLQAEADGALATAAYEEDIRQAIRIILFTNPGERLMRPDFGAGLNAFLFEPVNTTTLALLKNRVQEALTDWEPRIDLDEVSVTPAARELGKLFIEVRYRVRATNSHHNLVYPFYLAEGASQ